MVIERIGPQALFTARAAEVVGGNGQVTVE